MPSALHCSPDPVTLPKDLAARAHKAAPPSSSTLAPSQEPGPPLSVSTRPWLPWSAARAATEKGGPGGNTKMQKRPHGGLQGEGSPGRSTWDGLRVQRLAWKMQGTPGEKQLPGTRLDPTGVGTPLHSTTC